MIDRDRCDILHLDSELLTGDDRLRGGDICVGRSSVMVALVVESEEGLRELHGNFDQSIRAFLAVILRLQAWREYLKPEHCVERSVDYRAPGSRGGAVVRFSKPRVALLNVATVVWMFLLHRSQLDQSSFGSCTIDRVCAELLRHRL